MKLSPLVFGSPSTDPWRPSWVHRVSSSNRHYRGWLSGAREHPEGATRRGESEEEGLIWKLCAVKVHIKDTTIFHLKVSICLPERREIFLYQKSTHSLKVSSFVNFCKRKPQQIGYRIRSSNLFSHLDQHWIFIGWLTFLKFLYFQKKSEKHQTSLNASHCSRIRAPVVDFP